MVPAEIVFVIVEPVVSVEKLWDWIAIPSATVNELMTT
jgi:hypothetical protein